MTADSISRGGLFPPDTAAAIRSAGPPSLAEVAAILRRRRFNYANEAQLQEGIALVLHEEGIAFRREASLGPGDRPDFLLDGGIVIEVKVGGGLPALTRQVHRYAQFPSVAAILVVTTKMQHRGIGTDALAGKPVHVLHLVGSVL